MFRRRYCVTGHRQPRHRRRVDFRFPVPLSLDGLRLYVQLGAFVFSVGFRHGTVQDVAVGVGGVGFYDGRQARVAVGVDGNGGRFCTCGRFSFAGYPEGFDGAFPLE